jgi:hypothetical protein
MKLFSTTLFSFQFSIKSIGYRALCLINLLFYLISPSVQALVDLSLYEDQLPVKDSSALVREQTIPQILQQVLIKVSNNSNIATLESIKSKLINASSLVESYSYTTTNNDIQLLLTVKFDQKRIDQILNALEHRNEQSVTTITMVKGVKNLDDYNYVKHYFSSLNMVTNVEDITIGNDYIKLKITSKKGLVELTNAITESRLTVITPDDQNQDVELTCVLK